MNETLNNDEATSNATSTNPADRKIFCKAQRTLRDIEWCFDRVGARASADVNRFAIYMIMVRGHSPRTH